MKTFAIFGNPVEHSKSPNMHNHFFKHYNIDAKYISFCPNNKEEILDIFKEYNLDGANITVPFKEDAFLLCNENFDMAINAQSVNTIIKKDNKLLGYNTDASGLWHSISESFGENIKNALILGAGGTAKSIACILNEKNISTNILNRSSSKLKWFANKGFDCYEHSNFKPISYDLIINTTSAGLNDDALPLSEDILKQLFAQSKFAYDVIYNKKTSFIKLANNMNQTTQNGKDMLIYQGAFASLKFMDNKYDFEQTAKWLRVGFEIETPHSV